jgi:hypothetical protein
MVANWTNAPQIPSKMPPRLRNCSIKGRVRKSLIFRQINRSEQAWAILQRPLRARKTERKIARGNAVKPFGNSQKGIRKGRLTWVTASDKYPTIK